MSNPLTLLKEYIDFLLKDNNKFKKDNNVFKNFFIICAGLRDDVYENVYKSQNVYKLLGIDENRDMIEEVRLFMDSVRLFFKTNQFDKDYNFYITQKKVFVVEKK